MRRQPVFIEDGQTGTELQLTKRKPKPSEPPPEDELGGGDICSLEHQASTDDDMPLD